MCNWAAETNPQSLLHRADRKDPQGCSKGCASSSSFLLRDRWGQLPLQSCLLRCSTPLCSTQTSKAASSGRTMGRTPNPVKLHPHEDTEMHTTCEGVERWRISFTEPCAKWVEQIFRKSFPAFCIIVLGCHLGDARSFCHLSSPMPYSRSPEGQRQRGPAWCLSVPSCNLKGSFAACAWAKSRHTDPPPAAKLFPSQWERGQKCFKGGSLTGA